MSQSNEWEVLGSGPEIYATVFGPAMMGVWPPQVLALATPQPGDRILDVACGTGVLTRPLAHALGPQGRIIGLDISSEMLDVARRTTVTPAGAAPIEWREGDACVLPFAEASFERVFCAFGLMFFADRIAALREMHRVLIPTGQVTLTVWGAMSQCPGQTAISRSWERHFGADNAALFYRQHALGDPETVRALFHEAGFREVSVTTALGAVRLPSPEHLVRSYWAMTGIQTDDRTRHLVIEEVSAALQPYVGAGGLVYPIEAALASARK